MVKDAATSSIDSRYTSSRSWSKVGSVISAPFEYEYEYRRRLSTSTISSRQKNAWHNRAAAVDVPLENAVGGFRVQQFVLSEL